MSVFKQRASSYMQPAAAGIYPRIYIENPIFSEFPDVVNFMNPVPKKPSKKTPNQKKPDPENLDPEDSDEKKEKRPARGARNNNPGNIKFDPNALKRNPWEGQIDNSDGDEQNFAVFSNMSDGVRAAAILMMNYQKNMGWAQ